MKRVHRSPQFYSAVAVCGFNASKRVRVPAQTAAIPRNCLVSHPGTIQTNKRWDRCESRAVTLCIARIRPKIAKPPLSKRRGRNP